jgi:hypothetical protein
MKNEKWKMQIGEACGAHQLSWRVFNLHFSFFIFHFSISVS